MIFYNMRYRGPYEYDKFVLNVFQYCNLINEIKHDTKGTSSFKTLHDLQQEVDILFDNTTGIDGFSEQIYKNFIMNGDD